MQPAAQAARQSRNPKLGALRVLRRPSAGDNARHEATREAANSIKADPPRPGGAAQRGRAATRSSAARRLRSSRRGRQPPRHEATREAAELDQSRSLGWRRSAGAAAATEARSSCLCVVRARRQPPSTNDAERRRNSIKADPPRPAGAPRLGFPAEFDPISRMNEREPSTARTWIAPPASSAQAGSARDDRDFICRARRPFLPAVRWLACGRVPRERLRRVGLRIVLFSAGVRSVRPGVAGVLLEPHGGMCLGASVFRG